MTTALKDFRWALPGALVAEVLLVVSAFAWVAIYSYLIHPGEAVAFYEAYAQKASPYVALLVGMPLFYFVCRWIGARNPSRAIPSAIAVFAVYFVLELLILLMMQTTGIWDAFVVLSYITKLLACYFGGKSAC